MTDVDVMELTERAKHALVELHKEFEEKVRQYKFAKLGYGIHRPGYLKGLSTEYNRRVAEIINQGLTESRGVRMVRVQCPACGRVEQIAGDVERWTCVCGPFERMAFQTYMEA